MVVIYEAADEKSAVRVSSVGKNEFYFFHNFLNKVAKIQKLMFVRDIY